MITENPPEDKPHLNGTVSDLPMAGDTHTSTEALEGVYVEDIVREAEHVRQFLIHYLNKPAFAPVLQDEFLPLLEPLRRTLPNPDIDEADEEYPYSDAFNARLLVQHHRPELYYCTHWKTWLVWEGTHWQRDTTGQLVRWQRARIQDLYAQLPALPQREAQKLLTHIKGSLGTARLEAAIKQAQSWTGISIGSERFDQSAWLLNCANGTLDLRTGTLRPHASGDMLTKCLSTAYDATAMCPTWEAFLWRIMGGSQGPDDPDMGSGELENRQRADARARTLIDFLQRAIGYTLTGSTREQCLFILHGPTKTGKSTFLATIRAMMGSYGQEANMETFMHKDKQEVRNDLADLAGSRFVSAVEAQEGKRLAEALVKQMTGGADVLKARFLYEEYFTFKPQFKIFLGTNHKPVIRDTDSAIWERIRLVPFTVHIPPEDRDKDLDDKLMAEVPGILAWAVRGCLDWQSQGGLGEPAAVLEATTGYRTEMDTLGRFIEECCVVGPSMRVRASALYEAYKDWCVTTGEYTESLKALSKRLDAKGFEAKVSGGTWRLGLGLQNKD